MPDLLFVDMSKTSERNTIWSALLRLRGVYRIEITKAARQRSLPQNRLYFGVFVTAFRKHLALQGEPFSADFCHRILAQKFLTETAVCKRTGEHIGEVVRSTTTLSVSEFNQFLDNVHKYLTETFGIEIPTIGQFSNGAEHDHTNASR